MKRWSDYHRLRKYERKKRSRWSDDRAMLYWRYWHKVHGRHTCLWDEGVMNPAAQQEWVDYDASFQKGGSRHPGTKP